MGTAAFDTFNPEQEARDRSGFAHVATKLADRSGRRQGYAFPGLSGEGSTYFGAGPVKITWKLLVEAQLLGSRGSAIGILGFEQRLCDYMTTRAGRYRLITELGETFDNVELRSVKRVDGPRQTPAKRYLMQLEVEFEWMQPE